jgi:hypothetical protein
MYVSSRDKILLFKILAKCILELRPKPRSTIRYRHSLSLHRIVSILFLTIMCNHKLKEIYFLWCKSLQWARAIVEASLSHSDTSHSVGLPWMSDRPVAETSAWHHTTLTRGRHPRSWRDLIPQSPASERPRTHALDRAGTGIGKGSLCLIKMYNEKFCQQNIRQYAPC